MPAVRVDVAELVDRHPLTRFQLGAFVLVGACLMMDGFDVQAMGYAAPAVIRDWGIAKPDLGPVFGAGLLGLFVGSIALGVVADRVGRRPVLLASTAWFAAFTLLTGFAASIPQLVVTRFLAGLGLGAMMPNATALVGEYSPRARRVATMMIVTNGFMVGAVAGGFLSAWLIPAYGWRSVFMVGGALPLLLLGPMVRWLPESLQFLVVRGRDPARWARRIDPRAAAGTVEYVVSEERRGATTLLDLFRRGRGAVTALLWIAGFMNVLDAYFIASWLPAVLGDAGYATATAVLVGTVVQVGGALGTFAMGPIAERVGMIRLLAACFSVAAASLAVVAHPALPLAALVAVAFALGWAVFGGQPGLNALAGTYYPTELRSTGIGAALGVGRFGAILGPIAASELMRQGWTNDAVFRTAALPAIVATLAVLGLGRCPAFRPAAPGRTTPRSRPPARIEGSS